MKRLIYIVLSAFSVTCCAPKEGYTTYTGPAQGTTYRIVANPGSEAIEEGITSVFEQIDLTFSMFNPASLVSRINRGETSETTPLFDSCFGIARRVWSHSGGYYDITVKPLVDAWGFGPGEEQAEPCVDSIMQFVGMDKVEISGGRIAKDDARLQLDFSSVAKGFTVDCLAQMLEREGARDYLVEVGGEVRVKGVNAKGNPWRIGINRPEEGFSDEYQAVVTLGGALTSIATSGNYRNWFTDEAGHRRVHTIDPTTGRPAIGSLLSVSIAAPTCAKADAFATALMASGSIARATPILPPEGVEYFIIYTDEGGSIATLHSPAFPFAQQ
ncbi:MAG: FAD:protein FMN transferase [Rikenellaceae bacterium]|jgi:thiamine biosynthesis lipoprotein|nr:FAD:protein FMN transferase [Rikenellaceae bacterium]